METQEINQIKQENKEEKKTVRDTLYGRIDVSTKTMDRVLYVLFSLLVIAIIIGVIV